MTDLEHHFIQLKKELSLTSEERAFMRSYLEELTDAPIMHASIASPYSYLSFFMQPARFVAALLVIALVGAGTTASVAEAALPGDVLYGMKIYVNEEVEATLALSPRKKADVEIRHAKERLQEIQLLAASGEDARIVDASSRAKLRIETARSRIKSLISVDESVRDSESEFSYALSAHADILDAQAFERDDDAGVSMSGLALAARGDDDDTVSISAERAQKIVDKARERVDKNKLSSETHEALSDELGFIVEELAKAEGRGSVRGFALAERHAYRVLELVDFSERIAEKTGKKPFISFQSNSSKGNEKSSTATLMQVTESALSAPFAKVHSSNSDSFDTHDDDEERTLQFRVSDSDDDNSGSGKDDDDSHTGSGSSGSGSSGSSGSGKGGDD